MESIDARVLSDPNIAVQIEARFFPPGTIVEVIVEPAEGDKMVFQSSPLQGSRLFSTAQAMLTGLPAGPLEIVLRATITP